MAGPVVSTTRTAKPADPRFPAASVMLQITLVAPRAKVVPDDGGQAGVPAPATASSDGAVKVAGAPGAVTASSGSVPGTGPAGAVVSCTVTVKLPDAGLPAVSVAEHCTVVEPRANTPAGGVQVTSAGPLTMSRALAVKVTVVPSAVVASTVMFSGNVSAGAVV